MSLTAIATQMEATTAKFHDKELAKTGLEKNYFLSKLLAKAKETASGRSFTWRIKYAKSTTQWIGENEEQNTTPVEKITEVEVPYHQSSTPCYLSEFELQKNHGKERKLNLLSESLTMLRDDVADDLATQLISGDGVKEPLGLETWVAEDPNVATPTLATIVRSERTWMQNQYKDLSAGLGAGLPDLETLKIACAHGNESVNAVLTSRAAYTYIYANLVGLQREPHTDAAKLGFTSFTWDGMPVTWSDEIESAKSGGDSIYLLRLADWELNFMPGMRMKRTKWFKPERQRAIVCYMYNDCVLVCKKPWNQGVLHDVTGA